MNDDFQWGDDYQIDMLADRFEKMISSGGLEYFDSEEFEALIDFYQNNFDNERSRLALEMALQQHPSSLGLRVKFARQLLGYVCACRLRERRGRLQSDPWPFFHSTFQHACQ